MSAALTHHCSEAAESQTNGHEPLPEQSFFQGAAGKGHRPELTPSAAAILRDIDPQVPQHKQLLDVQTFSFIMHPCLLVTGLHIVHAIT